MEEKKSKEIKMEGAKGKAASNEEQKLNYEQLNTVCRELYQQNQKLMQQLQQANLTNMFKRLDYLFLVLKYAEVFDDAVFVGSCISEIKDAMTVPKEDKEESKE